MKKKHKRLPLNELSAVLRKDAAGLSKAITRLVKKVEAKYPGATCSGIIQLGKTRFQPVFNISIDEYHKNTQPPVNPAT